MREFLVLTLLQSSDEAGLAALGETKALAEIIEIIEAIEYAVSAKISSSLDIFDLGHFLAQAHFPAIDRDLLIWALVAPSSSRFYLIIYIIKDMWLSLAFWGRVDRERLDLLLRLRDGVTRDDTFEGAEERFLKTIARLLDRDRGQGLPPETQALLIETMLALPMQGFSSIDAEETYLIQCAPRLRERGIEPPTGYASFFAHLR